MDIQSGELAVVNSDITQLPSYETSNPDFIFTDIQLGKGKARNQREIVMNIDSQEEAVLNCIMPCDGVKLCPLLIFVLLLQLL